MGQQYAPTAAFRQCWAILLVAIAGSLLPGCGSPNKANIALRRENQALKAQVTALSEEVEQSRATVAAMRAHLPTEPTLPSEELAKLYTVHSLKLGRLTGGMKTNPDATSDQGVVVYVVPIDGDNQPIKAAGTFLIEAFDLESPEHPLVGTWAFDLQQAHEAWRGFFLFEYTYVLKCPWQTIPRHGNLTLRITFTDELTRTPLVVQTQVKAVPPPQPAASQP